MHACIQMYKQTLKHTHIHLGLDGIHTYLHTFMHAYIHTNIHTVYMNTKTMNKNEPELVYVA